MIRNKFIVYLCCVVWLGVCLSDYAFAAQENSATIFIYHKFGEDKYPTTNVALDRFEEQMHYLKENSYNVISLSELVGFLSSGNGIVPEKTVAITIDDGYTSTYTGAWPILKKYQFPFTVFLYVKAVESNYRNFLTWDQIKEMQETGVDFQPHTYSHHRFGTWDKSLDEAGYRKWISTDFKKGAELLEAKLGNKPRFLALPYGEYNSIIIEEAKKIGFEAVLSQDPGSISSATDPFRIPREPILGNDWSTMPHFAMVLERKDLPIRNVYPAAKPLVDLQPENFCATIIEPEKYIQDSFGIYVSELGWKKKRF